MPKVVSAKTGTITENGKVTGNIYAGFYGTTRFGGGGAAQDVLVKEAMKEKTVETQQAATQKKAEELGLVQRRQAEQIQVIKEKERAIQIDKPKPYRTVRVFSPSENRFHTVSGSEEYIAQQTKKIGRRSRMLRESKAPGFAGRFIRYEEPPSAEELRIQKAPREEIIFEKPSREMTARLPPGVSSEAARIANIRGVSVKDIVSFKRKEDAFVLEHRDPQTSKIELMTGYSQDLTVKPSGVVEKARRGLTKAFQYFVSGERPDEKLILKEEPLGAIADFSLPAYKRKKIVQEQIARYPKLRRGEVLRRTEKVVSGLYSTSFDVLKGGFDIATDFGVYAAETIKRSPIGKPAQKFVRELEFRPMIFGVPKKDLPGIKPFGKVVSGEVSPKEAKERVAAIGAFLEMQVLEFGLLFGAGKVAKGFGQATGILADVKGAVVPVSEGVAFGGLYAGAKTVSKFILPKIPKGTLRTGYKYAAGISEKGLLPVYFGYQGLKVGGQARELIKAGDVPGLKKLSVRAATGLGAFSFGAGIGLKTTRGVLRPVEAKIELEAALKEMPLKERIKAKEMLKISEKLGEQKGVLKGTKIKSFESVRVERLTKREVNRLANYLKTEPSAIVGGTASTQPQLRAKSPIASDVDIYSPEYRRVAREVYSELKEAGAERISLVGANTKNPRIYIRGKKAVEFHDTEQLLFNLGKTRKFFEPTSFSITQTPEGVRIVKFSAQIKRKAAGGIEQPERASKDFPYIVETQKAMGISTKDLFRPKKGLLYEKKAQITFPEFKVKILDKTFKTKPATVKDLIEFKEKPKKLERLKNFGLRKSYKRIKEGKSYLPEFSKYDLIPITKYLKPVKTKYVPSYVSRIYPYVPGYLKVPRIPYYPKFPSYPRVPVYPGYPKVPRVPVYPDYPRPRVPGYPDYPRPRVPGYPDYPRPRVPGYPDYPRPRVPGYPGYPKVPRIPPITKTMLLPGELNVIISNLSKRSKQAFKAVITAEGKPSIETKALTRLGALQAGILSTGETAKRTFEIVAAAGVPKKSLKVLDVERVLREKYRKPIKKGIVQLDSRKWIEKIKFAIDRPTEFREITLKGLRTPRKKKRSNRRK